MKILILISVIALLLIMIFILYVLFNCIYLKYIQIRNFKTLKNNIISLNNNIKELKFSYFDLPYELLNSYDESVFDYITNDIVTTNYYIKLQNLYKSLIEYKKIVNSIDNSIISISKSKSDILNYIQYNYPYCEEYIKEELNKFITEIYVDNDNDYNKVRMNRLINEQKVLDNKLTKFLNKIVKINNIISDYRNFDNRISELNKLNLVCENNRKILEYVKVGNRYISIVKTDFEYYTSNMKFNLKLSLKCLNDDDFNNSMTYYGNYVMSVSLLTSTYNIISKLLIDYNNSDKYIKFKSKEITNLSNSIEEKIFKLGVKNDNRLRYEDYKNDILIYKKILKFDVISASEKHKDIIKNLNDLLIKIELDIKIYYKNKKM